MVGRRAGVPETGVAGLARPAGNGRTAAYLARFMAGGPGNPLGARALYLGHTVFRIHGTNQPGTIGHAVSSGCFRLDNANVTDLYGRVQVGAKVLVRQSAHVSSCELGRCAIVAKNGLQPVWFPSQGWSCAWLAWAFASAPLAAATPGDRGQ
jgi:L,D-transpeptidase catalytic domain